MKLAGQEDMKLQNSAIETIDIHPDVVSLLAPIEALPIFTAYQSESEAIASAVEKRRNEFLAGRNLARIALTRLGVTSAPIPRNADRSPRWPVGTKGSISHNDEFVMVAVTQSPEIVGIGIDVEGVHSVESELHAIVRTDYREHGLDLTTLFSAKESVFKAVYPSCGEHLEHADVTVVATHDQKAFSAIGNPNTLSSAAMSGGEGRILSIMGLVVTAFWVQLPHSSAD